jgi:hypothetical protein
MKIPHFKQILFTNQGGISEKEIHDSIKHIEYSRYAIIFEGGGSDANNDWVEIQRDLKDFLNICSDKPFVLVEIEFLELNK